MLIGWKHLGYPNVYIILSNIYLWYTKSVLIRPRLFWGEFHPSYLQVIAVATVLTSYCKPGNSTILYCNCATLSWDYYSYYNIARVPAHKAHSTNCLPLQTVNVHHLSSVRPLRYIYSIIIIFQKNNQQVHNRFRKVDVKGKKI